MLSQNNSSNFRLTDATGTSFKLALQKCLWAMTQQNNKQKIKRSLCNLRVHSHYFPASENLSVNPSESKVCNGALLNKCRCFFRHFRIIFFCAYALVCGFSTNLGRFILGCVIWGICGKQYLALPTRLHLSSMIVATSGQEGENWLA